jgi:sigma-B regulation protein RsbU (phosphoserine phosphatase)
MNASFEEFGDERFTAILEKSASDNCQQIIDNILSSVSDFVGEAEQSDDITLLVLKKLA